MRKHCPSQPPSTKSNIGMCGERVWGCTVGICRDRFIDQSCSITLGSYRLSLHWSLAGWRFSSETCGDTLTAGRYLQNQEWQ